MIIDIKLCQIYKKKSYLCNLTDHIQQIRNQSEDNDIPQEPENLRFAPIIMFILDFGFLIDIIDNIITHSP